MPDPTQIGRYQILEEIAHGSMGTVYRARDTLIERVIALKVVKRPGPKSTFHEHEAYLRFLREAKAAGNLSHASIVTIFDVGEDEAAGVSFIAMEFIDGETLEKVLRRRERLPYKTICDIGIDVASALEAAHWTGVVHRDIKPANLILTSSGRVKVADFGIAKITASEMTHDGMILGSPNYLSPEQVKTSRVDHRSDIFSLGTVLYELVTLHSAFPGSTVFQVIQRVVSDEPALPSSFRPDVPAALEAVILKAMAKRAEDRYADAGDLRQALEAVGKPGAEPGYPTMVIAGGAGAAATDAGIDPVPAGAAAPAGAPREPASGTAPARRRAALLAAAAVMLMAAAAGAAWWLNREPAGDDAALVAAASPTATPGEEAAPSPVGTAPGEASPSPTAVAVLAAPVASPRQRPTPADRGKRAPSPIPSPSPSAVSTTLPSGVPSVFPAVLEVTHLHRLGNCSGRLSIDEGSIAYVSSDRARDSRRWSYAELQGLDLGSAGTISFAAAESDGEGKGRKSYSFHLDRGELPAKVREHLKARIKPIERPADDARERVRPAHDDPP